MAINYVKFVRGTVDAFTKLSQKDDDTLYFISEPNSQKSSLYLGNKIISKSVSNFEDLNNILLNSIEDKNLISYDANSQKWVNKSVVEAIGIMTGAKEDFQGGAGLVPAPGIGQQELFLRGDGVWATPNSITQLSSDNKTIEISDSSVLSLKNFGKQYYKYIMTSGNPEDENYIPAHYELQVVDITHPWSAGLEPKVVEEDGELVLGWFEPNTETIEGVKDSVIQLDTRVNDISNQLNIVNTAIENIYTKTETENLIAEEISKTNHLIRKVFNSIAEAEAFAYTQNNPENYIYMILASQEDQVEKNKYNEYLWIEDSLEKIGSWSVDLSDYATKSEVTNLDNSINIALSNKADKTELNLINSSITNIETLLNNKADKSEIEKLDNAINLLSTDIFDINSKVGNIESILNENSFVKKEEYDADIVAIKEAITWKNL